MSSNTYTQLWKEATTILAATAKKDRIVQNEPYQLDKAIFHKNVSEVYYKYIIAANYLNDCYDQMVQPQKRLLVRKMLDSCLIRIIELKGDLVSADLDEFNYNDDVLIKLQITPFDGELEAPKYFRREREEHLSKYNKLIDEVRLKNEMDVITVNTVLTEDDAIKTIQIHERARQGRFRTLFMRELRRLKELGEPDYRGQEQHRYMSANRIQKAYRGYKERSKLNKHKTLEMLLLGQLKPPPAESAVLKKARETEIHKHEVQVEYQNEYEKALVEIENKIKEKQTYDIMDAIGDEIRLFFRNYVDINEFFPLFPEEEEGGSKPMLEKGLYLDEAEKKKLKEKGKKQKKEKKTKKEKKGKEQKKSKPIPGYKSKESKVLPEILAENNEYDIVWKSKDESNNPNQRHNSDIIYQEKYEVIESDLRKIVDELMRVELELLEAALDRDNGVKPQKKKKKKKNKGKKGKKGKKAGKDLTKDKTTEELVEELVTNKVIRKYPEVSIKSFMGEKSYGAFELRNLGKDPPPSLGDVRQIIMEYCILPMGSEIIHKSTPLIKSVLITGPPGSGKKMLVNAICTALGAIMFDLSAANIHGKYNSKRGLVMLVHLVNKLSRILQPSVIFIDEAEMMYAKKIPKEITTNPKRLAADLTKIVKGISADDKVLVIGTSSYPWNGTGAFLKTFQKCIAIPRPDYGTRSFFLKHQLRQYSGMHVGMAPHFEVSCIAKLSEGYTIGEILKVLKSILMTQRNIQLQVYPLKHEELLVGLLRHKMVSNEDIEAARKWWDKTPIGKLKAKAISDATNRGKKK